MRLSQEIRNILEKEARVWRKENCPSLCHHTEAGFWGNLNILECLKIDELTTM